MRRLARARGVPTRHRSTIQTSAHARASTLCAAAPCGRSNACCLCCGRVWCMARRRRRRRASSYCCRAVSKSPR
eukprot:2169777-Prymnesium_polylepis.1